MIDIATLVALRDGASTTADEGLRRVADVALEQDPAAPPSPAGEPYPARRLVLNDGRYHVADHDK